MAEALVSALVGTVIGNLNLAAVREIKLLWGLEDELERLESVFSTIQLVLQDAEVKQRNNDVLQNWLRKLKDAAYDADDVLDQIATAGLRRRWISERGKRGYLTTLTSFFSKRNQFSRRLEIAQKVKDIRGRLDALSDERLRFHLREGMMNNQVGVVESRQTSALVNESDVFGRDEETEIIVQKPLCDMADQDDLSVCAVWGMGGIGKTTLAQLVYNDERVLKHFELRIWVCVSEDFSLQRLVKAILEDVLGVDCSLTELNPLLRLLQDKLRGNKFLLVLDDVWNEEQSLWDPLKEALRCGSKGSGVMVTTRNEKIARMMATAEIMSRRIGYLSDADSWSLFKRRAFACRTEDKNLVGIGEEIVKKCGGVPLAIKALGSLMRFKSHESEWLAVKESETWSLPDHGNNIFPVLMLSYDNLSPQMRQCFSYCCVFPKDYGMDKDELIQLWMSSGFLHEQGQKDLYLIGQSIFEELVRRSFLQDAEKHQIGKMRCKMHDLMHDLAESVMRRETYRMVDDNVQKIPPRVRHLSCDLRSLGMIKEKRDKLQLLSVDTVHSLINTYNYVDDVEHERFLLSFLSNQQHLRVLDLRFCRIMNFGDKWEHLRFLSMSCIELKTLPESITRLHNLQTLKLTSTRELRKLPEGLKHMKNLWFVEIDRPDSLICTPPGLGELTSLQRLSIFIVGEDSAHQISQLKELNLGGELSIRGLENVRNLEDVKAANMITKRNLASLNLSWTSGANKISTEHFEATLENIQPHHNLEQIRISSYQGSRFPNWISAPAFINLSKITLERCEKCEHLPPLGKLPALKILKLVRLDTVRRLGTEWCGDGKSSFVALTHLRLLALLDLEEWIIPNSHESFLRLQYLGIIECPKLMRLPFLPGLKDFHVHANPAILGSMIATSIESLRLIDDADELSFLPGGLVSAQKNLKKLEIKECRNLRSLSIMLDDLCALKKLSFDSCTKLEYPPEGLKFLEELEFFCCDSLRSFPAAILENMSSLRSLTFLHCKKLDPLSGPLQRAVSSLHELAIIGCPELKCLPESIQQLSALRKLRIEYCSGLCSLPDWIGNLQSLSTFTLTGCRNLTSLPDSFENLKSLSVLDVRGSPVLAKRCERSKGEDWPKISHIPQIYIEVLISANRCEKSKGGLIYEMRKMRHVLYTLLMK
ncbi:disease resistance protein RGA2-like [Primulina tabacum]|uniref:disease resistance protein RGA2-like n=1 Tax=Primulina tabacum TaxID=48773 RepID=UPI003F5ABBE8